MDRRPAVADALMKLNYKTPPNPTGIAEAPRPCPCNPKLPKPGQSLHDDAALRGFWACVKSEDISVSSCFLGSVPVVFGKRLPIAVELRIN